MSEEKVISKKLVSRVFEQYVKDIYRVNGEIEKSRLGKILTVVDGAIADETQRKAVKDLVHDAWYGATAYRVYPQAHHVEEVLGIKTNLDRPIEDAYNGDYNPYIEAVVDEK